MVEISCISCGIRKKIAEATEFWLCGVCQAYYCPECAQYWKNQQFMPACPSMGRKKHQPKFLKLYEYKRMRTPSTNTARLLPLKRKTARILSIKRQPDKKISVRVYPPKKIRQSSSTKAEESDDENST
ncbi:MAG: hypothetical protein ACFFCZ_06935 [Promethearchaeota archaeon]